jgi:uncharacterized protein YjbJ (UPF0337 family)
MDKDRIKGTVNEIKGSVKEATGKVFNKPTLIGEGRQQKIAGRIQHTVGVARDTTRGK